MALEKRLGNLQQTVGVYDETALRAVDVSGYSGDEVAGVVTLGAYFYYDAGGYDAESAGWGIYRPTSVLAAQAGRWKFLRWASDPFDIYFTIPLTSYAGGVGLQTVFSVPVAETEMWDLLFEVQIAAGGSRVMLNQFGTFERETGGDVVELEDLQSVLTSPASSPKWSPVVVADAGSQEVRLQVVVDADGGNVNGTVELKKRTILT